MHGTFALLVLGCMDKVDLKSTFFGSEVHFTPVSSSVVRWTPSVQAGHNAPVLMNHAISQ